MENLSSTQKFYVNCCWTQITSLHLNFTQIRFPLYFFWVTKQRNGIITFPLDFLCIHRNSFSVSVGWLQEYNSCSPITINYYSAFLVAKTLMVEYLSKEYYKSWFLPNPKLTEKEVLQ